MAPRRLSCRSREDTGVPVVTEPLLDAQDLHSRLLKLVGWRILPSVLVPEQDRSNRAILIDGSDEDDDETEDSYGAEKDAFVNFDKIHNALQEIDATANTPAARSPIEPATDKMNFIRRWLHRLGQMSHQSPAIASPLRNVHASSSKDNSGWDITNKDPDADCILEDCKDPNCARCQAILNFYRLRRPHVLKEIDWDDESDFTASSGPPTQCGPDCRDCARARILAERLAAANEIAGEREKAKNAEEVGRRVQEANERVQEVKNIEKEAKEQKEERDEETDKVPKRLPALLNEPPFMFVPASKIPLVADASKTKQSQPLPFKERPRVFFPPGYTGPRPNPFETIPTKLRSSDKPGDARS